MSQHGAPAPKTLQQQRSHKQASNESRFFLTSSQVCLTELEGVGVVGDFGGRGGVERECGDKGRVASRHMGLGLGERNPSHARPLCLPHYFVSARRGAR